MKIHPRHKIYTDAKIRLTSLMRELMKDLTTAEIFALLSSESASFANSCIRSERDAEPAGD